ncbi:glycosyltransferase family protein [Sinomonas soli]
MLRSTAEPQEATAPEDERRPRGAVVVATVLSALVLLVLVNVVADPPPTLVPYSTPLVVAAAAGLLALTPLLHRAAAWCAAVLDRVPRRGRWALAAVGLLVLTLVPAVIGLAVRVPPGWDAGAVLDTATAFAQGTHYDFAEQYFAWYPNNLFLAFALGCYFKAVGAFGVTDTLAAAIWLHAVFMAVSSVLAVRLARRLAGPAAGVGTLLVTVPFVALGPWSGVPYSDTLSMPFPIAILLLADIARTAPRGRSIALWGAGGVLTAVGVQIKPTVVFALAAAGLTMMLASRGARAWGRTALAAAVALSVAGVTYLGSGAAVRAAHVVQFNLDANTQAVPFTHFLKMGATGRGGFNADDIRNTLGTPPADRFANGLNGYLDRVEAMGPTGYPGFLLDKLGWSLGDGSFYAWAEGVTRENHSFPAHDPLSQEIRRFYTFDGDGAPFVRSAWQAAWFAVLVLLVLSALVGGRGRDAWAGTAARLAFLALLVFLAFFENRARYIYLYVPVVAVLVSAAVADGHAALARRRGRRSPRPDPDRSGSTAVS